MRGMHLIMRLARGDSYCSESSVPGTGPVFIGDSGCTTSLLVAGGVLTSQRAVTGDALASFAPKNGSP
jgi:hypothetical protein